MNKTQKNKCIAEIVNSLSETERLAYITLYFNNLSNSEIATRCGYVNEKTFDKYNKKKDG